MVSMCSTDGIIPYHAVLVKGFWKNLHFKGCFGGQIDEIDMAVVGGVAVRGQHVAEVAQRDGFAVAKLRGAQITTHIGQWDDQLTPGVALGETVINEFCTGDADLVLVHILHLVELDENAVDGIRTIINAEKSKTIRNKNIISEVINYV